MKTIRAKDLKSLVGTNEPRPMLLCRKCGETFSAERGDYFAMNPEHTFEHCGSPRNMRLVTARTVYTDVVAV